MKGEGGRGEREGGGEKGENPSALLAAVFERIAAMRMAGLPILNPALRVEVVGMRPWQGRWLGVLVTPWTMSLVLMPGDARLQRLAPDEKAVWEFPSGSYEFMGMEEAGLGICHVCSLISPVHEFLSHQDAVAVAVAAIDSLMAAPDDAARDEAARQAAEAARLQGRPLVRKELTRRDFLRGAFLGGG